MKTFVNRFFLFTAAAMFVAVAAQAQTSMTANVPFGFSLPGGNAAAGKYSIQVNRGAASTLVVLRNLDNRTIVMTLGQPLSPADSNESGPRLVFRCGDAHCALSEIWTLNAGYMYPTHLKPGTGEHVTVIPFKNVNAD
ncbi:MAG TPA: hypothetical protein VHB50_08795 [Bryobacteraceae bacterium]|nr:hypothetical protein [Bryobacteraceae bacterium]